MRIRCENKNNCEISDLSISLENPHLKLVPIVDLSCFDVHDNQIIYKNNIPPNNFILINYSIKESSSGKWSIKIRSSFKTDSKTDSFDSWTEINIPKPWSVRTESLKFKDLLISTYRIEPELESNNLIKFFDSSPECHDSTINPKFVMQDLFDHAYTVSFFRKSKVDIHSMYPKGIHRISKVYL